MKIRDVVVTPIAFPDPPLLNSAGVHEPWALRTIVQVFADSFVGLGETYGDAPHLALVQSAASELIGLDIYDLSGLRRRVASTLGAVDTPDKHGLTGDSTAAKTLARVVSPFEVALLDLQGRFTGRPVHDLLGGKVRDRVPFSAYLFYKWAGHPDAEPDEWGAALDEEGIVDQARTMIDQYGFGSIKLKGGVFPPAQEIAAIRALRDAFPGLPLRLDPNAAWTVETSIKVASETAGLLEYLEDPTGGRRGMADVAAKSPMPLATNMCVVAFDDLPEAVELGSVGIVLADHHYWGGLRASAELAAICRTWGIGLSMHSNSHLGISLAAMTHLAAATPNLGYAVDTHTPWQSGVDVVADPLVISDGSAEVPGTPGLGVTLDEDALARLHENWLRCGIRERDDTGYRQRVEPGYVKRRPRW
ncbi:glucarate dehydratase family protein [Actinoplanes sp. NPDC051411]|uniref:glucarate dehydratase family protein n=1 Tax=Actinoplanes sp. NPDC051411 TaxID=3155522 RepID=UPI00341440DB